MHYITSSGKVIDLETLSEEQMSISDIAHHLTKTCKFGGALPLDTHYSVANHAIALAYYALDQGYDEHIQRCLLMYDAASAYIGDAVYGIKHLLPDYREQEARVHDMIVRKYDLYLQDEGKHIVKEFDKRIALDEIKTFFPTYYSKFADQCPGVAPLNIKVYRDTSAFIMNKMFLHTCEMVGIRD